MTKPNGRLKNRKNSVAICSSPHHYGDLTYAMILNNYCLHKGNGKPCWRFSWLKPSAGKEYKDFLKTGDGDIDGWLIKRGARWECPVLEEWRK